MTAPRTALRASRLWPIAPLALGLLLPACSSDPTSGYSTAPVYTSKVSTVAVPIFDNTTFSKGLEAELTDAIIKEIQRTTPWVVVQNPTAGSTLSGRIISSSMKTLSATQQTGYVQELSVELVVDFDFKTPSGQTLVSRRNFRASDSFIPARGTSERIEIGQHAAVQRMAVAIVAELRSNW